MPYSIDIVLGNDKFFEILKGERVSDIHVHFLQCWGGLLMMI